VWQKCHTPGAPILAHIISRVNSKNNGLTPPCAVCYDMAGAEIFAVQHPKIVLDAPRVCGRLGKEEKRND
jgi:hypothetical protein